MITQYYRLIFRVLARCAMLSAVAVAHASGLHITRFSEVSTNAVATVKISVGQSLSDEEVMLEIQTLGGTAGAVFWPCSSTTMSITNTSFVKIVGTAVSSISSNMILKTVYDESMIDSNIFTVTGRPMIDSGTAISIAENAIAGKVELQWPGPITTILSGTSYIVTFWADLPPNTLGPDYEAQVTIDAFSGNVLGMLGGS